MADPQDLARRIATRLGEIEGVVAVALGGSRARGDADPHSDLDLGIYYRPAHPPPVETLRALARELDDRHPPEPLTDFGGWGPWINGGGWLEIEGVRVDWLYRDLDKVSQVLADCRVGRTACHYQPGHPHGFHTHLYAGELHHGLALFDPEETFAALQAATVPYPPALKRALLEANLWEAGFALEICLKSAKRGEASYVAGCLYRCAACLVQVVFALNERYFINEKRSVALAASLPRRPERFGEELEGVLSAMGRSPSELLRSRSRLEALVEATRALCQGR